MHLLYCKVFWGEEAGLSAQVCKIMGPLTDNCRAHVVTATAVPVHPSALCSAPGYYRRHATTAQRLPPAHPTPRLQAKTTVPPVPPINLPCPQTCLPTTSTSTLPFRPHRTRQSVDLHQPTTALCRRGNTISGTPRYGEVGTRAGTATVPACPAAFWCSQIHTGRRCPPSNATRFYLHSRI